MEHLLIVGVDIVDSFALPLSSARLKTFWSIVQLSIFIPHRVWAFWWQGGKRRLRTSRCPCRGRLGTLKTPSCPWRGCPAAGQNLETGHLSRHYIAEISLNVMWNHNQQQQQRIFIKLFIHEVKNTSNIWVLGLYLFNKFQESIFICLLGHFVVQIYIDFNFFLYHAVPRVTQLPSDPLFVTTIYTYILKEVV